MRRSSGSDSRATAGATGRATAGATGRAPAGSLRYTSRIRHPVPPPRRRSMQTLLGDDLVRELNARFESSPPNEIIRWALESGLERMAVATAFQAEGTAIIHMAVNVRPEVPVLFLETGFHFAETLAFKERLTELLGLNVMDLTGDETVESQAQRYGERLYERDPKLCCELNKVIPLNRAFEHLDGWITGMRRDSAWTRKNTPILSFTELDSGKRLLKVNPIANWTRREAWAYLKRNG